VVGLSGIEYVLAGGWLLVWWLGALAGWGLGEIPISDAEEGRDGVVVKRGGEDAEILKLGL
jgi:hypothetical protein